MLNFYSAHREKELAYLLSEMIIKFEYELIRVKTFKNKGDRKFQIMIDKVDGTQIQISDCKRVHKIVLEALNNKDFRLDDCSIEVSSPGIDRPLTRIKDFTNNKNKLIKVKTLFQVLGKKKFTGYLKDVREESILIGEIDTNEVIDIRFDAISEAYLQYNV